MGYLLSSDGLKFDFVKVEVVIKMFRLEDVEGV